MAMRQFQSIDPRQRNAKDDKKYVPDKRHFPELISVKLIVSSPFQSKPFKLAEIGF